MPTEPIQVADPADVLLRPAEPEDADAIASLYTRARIAAAPAMPAAVHTAEEDRAWIAAQLARPAREAWMAEQAGELVGYVLLEEAWLDHLFIRSDRTGEGLGSVLIDLVKARRPDGFCLWVFESNAGARRFYARHGLVELEHTDGACNEERAPDVRMAWPGSDPLAFYRRLVDEVDQQMGDLLARRAALTRAVQVHKSRTGDREPERDAAREREITEALARRAPALGPERLARIVDAIITESLDASRSGP